MKTIVIWSISLILFWMYIFFQQWNYSSSVESSSAVEHIWELWVSPYWVEDSLFERFLDTKYSLSFWLYRLTRKEAEQILKNLSSLGLDISWIAENKPYEWYDKAFYALKDRLEDKWISVTDDEHLWLNFNHAKTYISDGEKYLISTANLTYSSIWKNREYWYAWNNADIASNLVSLFEKDLSWDMIYNKDIHKDLLICPVNCRQSIIDNLDKATSSIYVSAQYIQDVQLRDLLLQYWKTVDLRILLGYRQDSWWLDDFPKWTVMILPEPYLHTKNILIDESLLIHWSMNLSENSLDNNREIGIIIKEKKVINDFLKQFIIDWKNWVDYNDWNFEES